MRIWKYIGKEVPENEQICFFRLANNEYYPILLTFFLSDMAFGLHEGKPMYSAKEVLKWTPAIP